jgi:hypothetical protein
MKHIKQTYDTTTYQYNMDLSTCQTTNKRHGRI